MKKIVSIFLCALMILSVASVGAFAGPIVYADGVNNSKIACVDFLDFSKENNDWWAEQKEDGTWSTKDVSMSPTDDNFKVCGAYIPTNMKNLITYLNGKVAWNLTDNGEVLNIKSTSTSKVPGVPFCLDDGGFDITANPEVKGGMEYCKIRIRNYSSADQLSFGFTSTALGGGGRRFVTKTISHLDIDPVSTEWKTYTFSMSEINSKTNYGGVLDVNKETGVAYACWGGKIQDIIFYPFGYNIDDGTGAYEGAEMDVDYIVFGTKDYVDNYKSELEKKEEKVSKIEITKPADKTSYYVGETLDRTGLEIKATFNDGTTEILDSYNVVYNFNEEAAESVVTIKYGSASTTYKVKVTGIKDIAIETPPKTTTYDMVTIKSGSFAPEGLTIKVNYNDGTSAVKELGSFKLEYDALKPGKGNVITINFYGAKTSFTANVINVTSIEVEKLDKTYRYGGELADDDLRITCIYSDGSKKSLADAKINATIDKTYDFTKSGEVEVTVKISNTTYEIDCTATTTANVEAPTSLAVDTKLAKLSYNVDDKFSTEGLLVSYVYGDGSTVTLKAEDYDVKYDFSEPGDQKVTVTDKHANLSANFTATVEGSTKQTTPRQTTTTSGKTSGGCKSAIGAGAALAIVSIIGAGVVLGKKKEN